MTKQTIIHGDCMEEMPNLPANSFDTVLTDPPYFLPANPYMTSGVNQMHGWTETKVMAFWWSYVVAEMDRLVKPGGWIFVFCQIIPAAVFVPPMYPLGSIQSIVWNKGSMALGDHFRRQHELIIACRVRGGKSHKRANNSLSDVLTCQRVPPTKRVHPAQKPVKLLAELLEQTTPRDGNVLDPFAGSCSTGRAADMLGIRSTMIEDEGGRAELPSKGDLEAAQNTHIWMGT